jgi:hypothetical protein
MPSARFRFYEELNDFLAADRHKREFEAPFARAATVKNAIEALGVPHTEVELILVNGTSVDFAYRLREGDRVSVYPVFESFDIAPLLRVRLRPLRSTRFIADAHLGGLARLLRMAGFDTLYEHRAEDDDIRRRASQEDRIILTRDRALLMHRSVTHGCYLHALEPRAQFRKGCSSPRASVPSRAVSAAIGHWRRSTPRRSAIASRRRSRRPTCGFSPARTAARCTGRGATGSACARCYATC